MTGEQLKQKIFEAGIIGAGGAGFPTHVKLVEHMDYLVVNGAECEPLIYTDYELMYHYGREIVQLLKELIAILSIKKVVWGIKDKHEELINYLKLLTKDDIGIEIIPLENCYPVGDEATLIYKCTGRVVPRGQLPSSKKVMVLNVETLFNMYQCLFKEKVITEKYVTVTGAVEEAKVIKVPIGTSYIELIKAVKITVEDYDILSGGPMMGSFVDVDSKVTKTTKAIILLPKGSPLFYKKQLAGMDSVKRTMAACSQCRMCTDFCPRNQLGHKVEPHKLMNAFANGILEHSEYLNTALGCCGCNTCSYYACHHDLQPAALMMLVKKELGKKGIRPEIDEPLSKGDNPYAKVLTSQLITKIGLKQYDKHATWVEKELMPQEVVIALNAHIGKSAQAIVQVGEHVIKGQLIGKGSQEGISANIHSSVTGQVTHIIDQEITISVVSVERR